MKGIKLFLFFFTILFIASCSNEKQTNPVETGTEDQLSRLLKNAPEEISAAIRNEIKGDLRIEISREINNKILSYAENRDFFIAFVNASAPEPSVTGRCTPPLLTVDSISGLGAGTLIHKFTTLQSHCFDPGTNEFSDGQAVFTANTSGDQLNQTYSGNLRPTPFQNIFIVRGSMEFTGGTGMFTSATGDGNFIGLLHSSTGKFAVIQVGNLDTTAVR